MTQDSGLRWVNIYLNKSVSGSPEHGWRFWHVGCAPGRGQVFSGKAAAFAAAEAFTR